MTTTTLSFAAVLETFARQFTHPASRYDEPFHQVVILAPERAFIDLVWAREHFLYGNDNEPSLWVFVIDNAAFARFQQHLAEPTCTMYDMADTDADTSVPIEWEEDMNPRVAARLALNLTHDYPSLDEEPIFTWYHDQPVDGHSHRDGCRFQYAVLPEDWQTRADELRAMTDAHGFPAYPEELWGPTGHDYVVTTFE